MIVLALAPAPAVQYSLQEIEPLYLTYITMWGECVQFDCVIIRSGYVHLLGSDQEGTKKDVCKGVKVKVAPQGNHCHHTPFQSVYKVPVFWWSIHERSWPPGSHCDWVHVVVMVSVVSIVVVSVESTSVVTLLHKESHDFEFWPLPSPQLSPSEMHVDWETMVAWLTWTYIENGMELLMLRQCMSLT